MKKISILLTIVMLICLSLPVSAELTEHGPAEIPTTRKNYYEPEFTTIVDITAFNHNKPYTEERATNPETTGEAADSNDKKSESSETTSKKNDKEETGTTAKAEKETSTEKAAGQTAGQGLSKYAENEYAIVFPLGILGAAMLIAFLRSQKN